MENKQSNKSLIIICTILIVIIIGLVGFIGYYIGMTNQKPPQTNKQTNENIEVEETNINTIKSLSNKISQLFGYNKTELSLNKEYSLFNFKSGILKKNLTAEEKQLIILSSIEWDEITGDAWKSSPKMKDTVEAMSGGDEKTIDEYIKASKQISAEKVNKYSMELFGHELTNPKEEIGRCPVLYYDANQQIYYRPDPACGGASIESVQSYEYKFTTNKDEAYVYVSFAYIEPSYDNSTYNVYKDIKCSDELIGNCTLTNKYEVTLPTNKDYFTIDKTNYQDFSQYKFIFKKDQNNNYYFVKTEQIK